MSDSFVAAKQKAQAYRDQFESSSTTRRPASSTNRYLSADRGMVDPTPLQGQIATPAPDRTSDAIESSTAAPLQSLMNSGITQSTQQFNTLSGFSQAGVDAMQNLQYQDEINDEQLKQAKAGMPSPLSTALGFVNSAATFAGNYAPQLQTAFGARPPAG